jgi:hypothetical protein
VPPDPPAAPGQPPPSPAELLAEAGVAPPRPLVWVGHASSSADVWSSPVANGVGMALWSELVEAAGSSRCWPVLTGGTPVPTSWSLTPDAGVGRTLLDAEHLPDAAALLDAAWSAAPDPPQGLRTRLEPTSEPTVEAALSAGYVALVTGVTGWQVPLTVGVDGLGGWDAFEHASVLRRWSERYKTQLVALTDTSVGVRVGRPPRTHEDAMAAAREIYAYCPDVVTHGLGSLWALATTVAVSGAWSLRWQR